MTVTYTTDGGLVGVSFLSAAEGGSGGLDGGFGGGGGLPSFGRTLLAELTSSLILDEGTGGPTWSRATKAWAFNELGYLEELASGCAFFGGARLVRNFLAGSSQDLSSASWSKTGSPTITYTSGVSTVTTPGVATECKISQYTSFANSSPTNVGKVASAYWKIRGTNGQTIKLGVQEGAPVYESNEFTHTFNGDWQLVYSQKTLVSVTGTQVGIYFRKSASDAAITFDLAECQLENITGYDASYVPEYVSVGSDTDKNFLLHTDDFSQAAWSKTNITVTQSAIANPVNGRIDAQKVEATAGALTTFYQSGLNSGSTAGNIFALYVKQGSGETDANRFVIRNQTTTTNLLSITVNYSTGGITYLTGASGASVTDAGNGWWLVKLVVTSGISTNDNVWIYAGFGGAAETAGKFFYLYRPYLGRGTTAPAVIPAVAGTWDPFGAGIDGAKYFETDWQGAPIPAANLLGFRREAAATNNLLYSRDLSNAAWSTKTNITAAKTATGLDGIANTATTLTADAADATILQPITLASAARCASAYVKRRTGTGTISFTQDGGSTWTDITSQINSSTWSRVEITATLANPSVGFKISTSGDAIDVDCVQNEAGAVATSPIVTTTAAVTRNADSLTYQTASNIDFAVGTCFAEVMASPASNNRMALDLTTGYIGTSGSLNNTWRSWDNTALAAKAGLSDISTGKRKRATSWGPTGQSTTGDGLVPAVAAFDGTIGSGVSMIVANNFNGYIGPVAIYDYQMTDAELQAITS